MKKLLAVVFLITSLFVVVPVSAQNTSKNIDCTGDNICFTPQISLPGTDIVAGEPILIKGDTIGKYIVAIYTFGVYAGGIVATIVLMAGGFVWLLAGGNTSQVEQARTMITGAVTGYVLLLFSWVLLNTINPNLTQFKPLDIAPVENEALDPSKVAIEGVSGPCGGVGVNSCAPDFSCNKAFLCEDYPSISVRDSELGDLIFSNAAGCCMVLQENGQPCSIGFNCRSGYCDRGPGDAYEHRMGFCNVKPVNFEDLQPIRANE